MAENAVEGPDIEGNSALRPLLVESTVVGPDRQLTVRSGIFHKYTNQQRANILWKISLAISIFGFVLALTGVAIDKLDNQEEVHLTLNGFPVIVPSFVLRTASIELGTDGCEDWKVYPEDSPLHSRNGMLFRDLRDGGGSDLPAKFFLDDSARLISTVHGGDFQEFYIRGYSARIFSIFAVVLQGIAIVWSLVFRVPPSAFLYNRPLFGQSHKEHLLGCVFHLILTASAVLLLITVALICSFRVPLLSRIANFSLDWCKDSPFDGLARGQHSLEYMKFLGEFIQNYSNASGVSFLVFAMSMFLIYLQLLLVFFLGLRQVKSESRVNFSLPNSQLHALPWYAKILPMKASVLLLIVAVVANCATAFSARVRGFPLNVYMYNATFNADTVSQSWSLPDLFLDQIHQYVVDGSMNKILLAGWVPLLALVGLGTVDVWRYLSKSVETVAVLIFGSAIAGIVSVAPTPSSVLQKPQCYVEPQTPPSFGQFFSASESCNDGMYSLFACLIMIPVMVVWFYIRYGPLRRKRIAYLATGICMMGSLFCLVATRQHYSVDIYLAVIITILYCLSQSAAFKLLFRFGVVHPGMHHKPPVVLSEKIIPVLDDLIRRFDLFFMAAEGDCKLSDDDIRLIQSEFNTLAESIEFAKAKGLNDGRRQAKDSEEDEEEDMDDEISTDNLDEPIESSKKDS